MFANFECAFKINNFHLMSTMNANVNSNAKKRFTLNELWFVWIVTPFFLIFATRNERHWHNVRGLGLYNNKKTYCARLSYLLGDFWFHINTFQLKSKTFAIPRTNTRTHVLCDKNMFINATPVNGFYQFYLFIIEGWMTHIGCCHVCLVH